MTTEVKDDPVLISKLVTDLERRNVQIDTELAALEKQRGILRTEKARVKAALKTLK